MKSKVSILLPVYNGESYIRRTIESILRQEYDHLEILISDNCSQDRTIEIIHSFDDGRIKVFRQDQNRGIFANHNFLLKRATGDFIKYVHADDDIPGNSIQDFIDIFLSKNKDVAYVAASSLFIDHDGVEMGIFPFVFGLDKYWVPNELTLLSRRLGNIIGNPMSVMFRRESVVNLLFDEENKSSSDWKLLLSLSSRFPVYTTGKVLTKYRIHEESTSSKNHGVLLTQWEDLKILSERNPSESDEEYLAALWRQHVQIITKIFQFLKEGQITEAKENLNKLFIYDKGLEHYEQGKCKQDLQEILEIIDKGECNYFGNLQSLFYGIIIKTNISMTYEFYELLIKIMSNRKEKMYSIKIIGYDRYTFYIMSSLLRSFNVNFTGIVNIYNNINSSLPESIPVIPTFQYDNEDYLIILSPTRMNDFFVYYRFQEIKRTFGCEVIRFREWIL